MSDIIELAVVEEAISITELEIGFQPLGEQRISQSSRTVVDDFDVTLDDYEILIDATDGPITGNLPQNTKLEKGFHFKRIDSTNNLVKIHPFAGDNIDGSGDLFLDGQYSDAFLFAADVNYWDNFGIANALIIPSSPPPTPTNLDEVIALLASYDLCQPTS